MHKLIRVARTSSSYHFSALGNIFCPPCEKKSPMKMANIDVLQALAFANKRIFWNPYTLWVAGGGVEGELTSFIINMGIQGPYASSKGVRMNIFN